MKNTILTLVKYILICAAVILALLLIIGFVLVFKWPWWVGFFILICVIGLCFGGFFLRKLLQRRKEQQFVQQVIEQDDAQLQRLSAEEQGAHKALQNRWKEAVETLKKSHLKKQGNPLYVLPWYLVMGESGSGKTTAISSARISSPFAETSHTSGISGTRNCDWWFFDQAILIDTAGRYAMPIDSAKDSDEWQQFLTLLVKYRKKEPIHGLIITIAADKLMNTSPETLEEDGKTIRRRIDELMRVLGIKFPVYLLATKCDLVQGMSQFSDQLPEKSLEQPMGVVNQELAKDIDAFISHAMESVSERLKSIRILLLHKQGAGPENTGVLLFPDEFGGLKPGLTRFMKAAFQENNYQDTPVLRGLYFSSGRQEGTPYSHMLSGLGLINEKEILPGTNKGLFLHDFFEKILPGDRRLLAPTTHTLKWQLLTRNLGLTSWILLGVAMSGLLSYAFVKNLSTIQQASAVFTKTPDLKGDFMADLASMDGFRQMVVKIEIQNQNWWVPRFGLNESKRIETRLKTKYCLQFHDRFLVSFDKNMNGEVAGFSAATPDETAAHYIVHLVRRINLLKSRLNGSGFDELRAKPLPTYMKSPVIKGEDTEFARKFGYLYVNYLVWRSDSSEISREIDVQQALLKQVLAQKGSDLHWLVEWTNRQIPESSVTLQSFWGGGRNLPEEITVAPAYTKKGKEVIESFENELNAALPVAGALDREKSQFMSWYKTACISAWQRFAAVFPKGEERLADAKELQAVAATMASDKGPYLALLSRIAIELEPYFGSEGLPSWLQQVFQYQILKTSMPASGVVSKTTEEGKLLLGKLEKLFGRRTDAGSSIESQIAAAKSLQEYLNALNAIAAAAKSRNQAFQLGLQVYSEDAGSSKSPVYAAHDASQRLKGQMAAGRLDETFWRLVSGPLNFLWNYVRQETSCSLQSQWEEKVLQEVQGVSGQQAMQFLLAPEGPVWKFVKGPAAPFLGWAPQRGYYSKIAMGSSIPFESEFYTFLTKGAKAKVAAAAPPKQGYTVSIRGVPTDANPESRVKPQSTRLELQCASGSQIIENLNFPVSKNFLWSPESCGDVIFQIDVGEVVLTKKYSGPQAFPEFLQDFQGGRRMFYPRDFPREKTALEKLGIRNIRVAYQMSGVNEIVGQAKSMSGLAPRSIARCWK